MLNDLIFTAKAVKRSETAQLVYEKLTEEWSSVSNIEYKSFILAGGAGFGNFSPASSDIDTWIIINNASPDQLLKQAITVNVNYNRLRNDLIDNSYFTEINFRHPPTILSENEAYYYRQAFAAKIGLPMYLGVFPTLLGKERKGELCFSEPQLYKDLAYSCHVFQSNLLNPPKNGKEDPLRYCYKRATYFLRFTLLFQKGKYIARISNLLDEAERLLPEWKSIIPILRKIYLGNNKMKLVLNDFQKVTNGAMDKGMNLFMEKKLTDDKYIQKGDLRTKIFWTIEKLRWDYLITPSDNTVWGFTFTQLDELFKQLDLFLPNTDLIQDWNKFAKEHAGKQSSSNMINLFSYYENTYHPKILEILSKSFVYLDKLI
jgi:hypothetical protein